MPDDTLSDPRRIIADLRRELTRVKAERDDALDQQQAIAEVLGVINASPGDLAPVFDAILEKAMRLCEVAHGHVFRIEDGLVRAVAARGEPGFVDWIQQRDPISPAPGTMAYRMMRGERIIHTPDSTDTDIYRAGLIREIIDGSGVRTTLGIALRRDDALLGAIMVNRQEVRPFTDKQIALLENFAAQAVIAMENARLITETREALDQQTATAEVLGVINASPGDLAPVFEAMLEKAMTLCGVAFGALMSYDGETVVAVATRGLRPELVDVFRERIAPRREGDAPYARFLRGEPLLHIVDMAAEDVRPSLASRPRALVEIGGARTGLEIPLRKEAALLGSIWFYRQEVRPFSEKQIALLQNFAAQAVIAMENARLITETREALEQQTATAEVLGVINSSPGDLAPVFDAILERAHTVCGATHGSLQLYDAERLHAVATKGVPTAFADILRQGYVAADSPASRDLIAGSSFTHILDAAEVDHLVFRSGASLAGMRTALFVPLRRDDAFLGLIAAARLEVRPFTDKQIALLQNFAAQAVIAMENARLITETREALDQQTATSEVLQVINLSPRDLAPVFDAILEKALSLCNSAYGQLTLYDGEYFDVVAVRGVPAVAEFMRSRGRARPAGGTSMHRLSLGENLVHILDALADEGYQQGDPSRRALVEQGGMRTLISVALRRDETLLGALSVYRQEIRPFSEKEIALLQNFAAQAVIAMENARLLDELRARTDEIAGWNRELEARVATQLAEIERTGKLRRFLAPQLADLIVAQGDESILESHRREIVVVFCDLRGFTGFAERAEPEEVMALLGDYHAAMGPIVAQYEGTLDHYAGDGIMVFFNDPVPTPDPARRAIDMAVAMRAAAQDLLRSWRRHGHEIGFGVGISQGYATLGQIGFAERMDYTAIGTVTNLAARLCGEAKDGQILVSRRVAIAVEDSAHLEEIGDLSLKGLSQAVAVFNVIE